MTSLTFCVGGPAGGGGGPPPGVAEPAMVVLNSQSSSTVELDLISAYQVGVDVKLDTRDATWVARVEEMRPWEQVGRRSAFRSSSRHRNSIVASIGIGIFSNLQFTHNVRLSSCIHSRIYSRPLSLRVHDGAVAKRKHVYNARVLHRRRHSSVRCCHGNSRLRDRQDPVRIAVAAHTCARQPVDHGADYNCKANSKRRRMRRGYTRVSSTA